MRRRLLGHRRGGVNPNFPSNNLLSYYPLEDLQGTTTVKDTYGTFDGTTPIGTTNILKEQPGKIDLCYRMKNGAGESAITVPNPGITNKASFNMWLKLDSHTPTDSTLTGLGNFNTQSAASHYPFTDGNLYISLFTSTRKTITTNVIPDRTQWHMMTVTADAVANEWKFYLNDTLVTTSTVGTLTMNTNIIIARSNHNNLTYYLKGEIDQINFHGDVLTLSEIQTLYNNGLGIKL